MWLWNLWFPFWFQAFIPRFLFSWPIGWNCHNYWSYDYLRFWRLRHWRIICPGWCRYKAKVFSKYTWIKFCRKISSPFRIEFRRRCHIFISKFILLHSKSTLGCWTVFTIPSMDIIELRKQLYICANFLIFIGMLSQCIDVLSMWSSRIWIEMITRENKQTESALSKPKHERLHNRAGLVVLFSRQILNSSQDF